MKTLEVEDEWRACAKFGQMYDPLIDQPFSFKGTVAYLNLLFSQRSNTEARNIVNNWVSRDTRSDSWYHSKYVSNGSGNLYLFYHMYQNKLQNRTFGY